MRQRHRPGVVLGLVAALLAFAVARGQDPASGPTATPRPEQKPSTPKRGTGEADARAEPSVVMSASVASLEKIDAFTKKIGLEDLPSRKEFVEQNIPFIGPGGLAGDRPLGVLLYARPKVDIEDTTFVLPVNRGKAGIQEFLDSGAQPYEGKADTVVLQGMGYRRTEGLFVFGRVPAAVAAVREDALAAGYAGNELLGRIDVDVAAIKREMPADYERLLAALGAGPPPAPEVRDEWDAVTRPLRSLERMGISFAASESGGLRVSLTAEPFALPAAPPREFRPPGFPAGTFFRADIAHPPAKALGPLVRAFKLLEYDVDVARATKEQRAQYAAIYADFEALILAGEGASFGVETIEGKPVNYWVTQHAAGGGPDFGRLMKSLATRHRALVKAQGKDAQATLTHETYPAGEASKAHRLLVVIDGRTAGCLDVVRRGDELLMTFASGQGKYVERLLPLKPEAPSAALASGWLNLGALDPGALAAEVDELGIGETAVKELIAAMKGQRLNWVVSGEGDAARLDVDVPKLLIRTLPEALGLTQ